MTAYDAEVLLDLVLLAVLTWSLHRLGHRLATVPRARLDPLSARRVVDAVTATFALVAGGVLGLVSPVLPVATDAVRTAGLRLGLAALGLSAAYLAAGAVLERLLDARR